MTAQVAAHSGSKRYRSDVTKESHLKKLRFSPLDEPLSTVGATLNSEARTQEDVFDVLEGSATDGIDLHCDVIEPKQYSARAASNASTAKKQKAKQSENVDADFGMVIAIVTKYETLFKIDLASEVEPNGDGPKLFKSAVEEGYVPSDLLRPELLQFTAQMRTAYWTALQRFTGEASRPESHDSRTKSDSNGSGASEESLELDVVQKYFLQPLPTPIRAGRLTVKEFEPLSAASETLEITQITTNTLPYPSY